MRSLLKVKGFTPYILVVLINAMVDLGHKIIIQNTVFKSYDGAEQIALTAVVNGLILLPFILLFSPAGFLSDKFPKHVVIRFTAAMAIPLTILITISYHLGWFWAAFGLTFLLAVQSAIYSPAKYGYIKELTGKELLGPANAAVQSVTIVAILAGAVVFSILFEGFLGAVEMRPKAILTAIAPCGYFLIAGAVLETIIAFGMPKRTEGAPQLKFDRDSYLKGSYLKDNVRTLRKNETIWLSVIGLAIFWAVNQVLLAAFGAHLKEVAHETSTVIAQGLLSLGGVGIIIGAAIAGRASRNYIETGTIPVGGLGMTACLFILPMLTSKVLMGALLVVYGMCGGLLIVPLNALIQFNARDSETGKVLAGNNFAQNVLMLTFLSGTVMLASGNVGSVPLMYALAVVVLGGCIYTLYKLPQSLLRVMLRFLVAQRYRLTVSGLDNIPPEGGVLLLGNHTSWIDWAVLHLAVPRKMRFVMLRDIYEKRPLKWFLDLFGVIPISARASKTAIQDIKNTLLNGECVVLFPEGAISRNGQLGVFKQGFEKAAEGVDCTIVPFYMRGLWGSLFSFATRKLRDSLNRGPLRDVTICFGPGMPAQSSALEVKQAVSRLSIDAWRFYTETFEPVHFTWLRTARRAPSDLAVIDSSGAEMTNRRFMAACFVAASMFKPLIRKQQNVGLLLPASAGGAIANMALLMRGKTVVNLNYTAGKENIAHAISQAQIKTVISSKQFLTKLKAKGFDVNDALDGVTIFHMEEMRERAGKGAFLRAMLQAQLLPRMILRLLHLKKTSMSDAAAILFSSGSEGRPKGVKLSHENIVGNVRQVSSIFNARAEDVFLGTLPLFHAFGLTVTTLLPLLEAIPVVFHPDPTDARGVGRLVAKHRITFLCGTPTFLGMYTRNRKLHPLMFESLRLVVAGAERLPDDVRKAFKEKFGKDVHEGYGATETTPVATVNTNDVLNPRDYTVQQGRKDGTVGLPLPGSTVRIVDPETMEDLPRGKAGLILIGGAQIMAGYLDDEAKTREVILEQGGVRWYKTGDKGQLDEDGFLKILDRYSRFAKIGGEMVSLGAVENAVLRALNTALGKGEESGIEVTAVAAPDDKKGERVVMLVQGVDDVSGLRKTVLEHGVEPLMAPAEFRAVAEIPKLGSGKRDVSAAKKLVLENA